MSQNHVIVSSDPATEQSYAALVGNGVAVYRFATAAETMQRLASVRSAIDALVIATSMDRDVDPLLMEVTAGSLAQQPLLARMRICVMGQTAVVSPRISVVRSSDELVAALRAPIAGIVAGAPVQGAVSEVARGSESGLLNGIVGAIWNRSGAPAPVGQAAIAIPAPVAAGLHAPVVDEVVVKRQMPRGTGRGRSAATGTASHSLLTATTEHAREQSPRIEAESLEPTLEPSLPFVLKGSAAYNGISPRMGGAALQRDHAGYVPVQVQTVTSLVQSGAARPLDLTDPRFAPQVAMSQQPVYAAPVAPQAIHGGGDPMLDWRGGPAHMQASQFGASVPMTTTPMSAPSAQRRGRFGKLRDRVRAGEQPVATPSQAQVDAALAQLANGGYGAPMNAANPAPAPMQQAVGTPAPVASPVFAAPSSVMDRIDSAAVQFG